MKIVIIDNFDSFTYNLVHYCEQFAPVVVMRNDAVDFDTIDPIDKIVLSPGPGLPRESGQLLEVIEKYHLANAMLGVCLGHQAISEFMGGNLHNLDTVLHGVTTRCEHFGKDPLFDSIPKTFEVGHYHSWAVNKENLGKGMHLSAQNESGLVMATRHESLRLHGVQFHPESIMTPKGLQIIQNFVEKI